MKYYFQLYNIRIGSMRDEVECEGLMWLGQLFAGSRGGLDW
jgi:hypothetical protein